MILAGDIGGTKTNLALFTRQGGELKVQVRQQFPSREFGSLEEVIGRFGTQNAMPKIEAACFGIAGPVIEGNCRTTNLPWEVSTSALQKLLGTQKVRLLNDLEATAYGMLYLGGDEFANLNPQGRSASGNRAVIAAGTGLGEAMLFHDGICFHPGGCEGGHTDFAPVTPQQDELLKWLRKRHPEHVSYERILSGPGIYTLYEFLCESGFAPQSASMTDIPEGKDRSAMVSRYALEENDPLCVETLRLFAEIYGAEAGNLALKTMSLGGVYIGGGIAPKILPFLTKHFMKSFVEKGRFKGMLREMEVKVALNQETALLGAAHFAVDRV